MYIGDIIRMRAVARYLQPAKKKGSTLLDAGAGAGIYKPLVLSKGYEYVGIDIKPRSPDIIYGDVTNIPFPENCFEVVLCVDTLEHVEKDYVAIKEMHRVLKPRGMLIAHTPNSAQTHILAEFPEQSDHVRKGYTREQLEFLGRAAGFTRMDIYPTFNVLETIGWELINLMRQNSDIDLRRLIDFDLEKFKNLGWLCIAWKG
jgi:ubiquinone/menaquinone biosynthesis C-methylase UbiE